MFLKGAGKDLKAFYNGKKVPPYSEESATTHDASQRDASLILILGNRRYSGVIFYQKLPPTPRTIPVSAATVFICTIFTFRILRADIMTRWFHIGIGIGKNHGKYWDMAGDKGRLITYYPRGSGDCTRAGFVFQTAF